MQRKDIDFNIYKRFDVNTPTKELFKQVVNLLGINGTSKFNKKKLIDIGGANGAFCYYVRTINNEIYLKNSDFNDRIIIDSKDFF